MPSDVGELVERLENFALVQDADAEDARADGQSPERQANAEEWAALLRETSARLSSLQREVESGRSRLTGAGLALAGAAGAMEAASDICRKYDAPESADSFAAHARGMVAVADTISHFLSRGHDASDPAK